LVRPKGARNEYKGAVDGGEDVTGRSRRKRDPDWFITAERRPVVWQACVLLDRNVLEIYRRLHIRKEDADLSIVSVYDSREVTGRGLFLGRSRRCIPLLRRRIQGRIDARSPRM
jgi:hypothetical protein